MASRVSFPKSICQSLSSVPRGVATVSPLVPRLMKSRFMKTYLLVLALAATGLATPVVAAIQYVAPTGTDSANDCTNPTSPCATISHALTQAAVNGDTVCIAAGTYT